MGGTHYYIESLIWKVLIEDAGSESDDDRLVYERDSSTKNTWTVENVEDDEQLLKTLTFNEEGVSHLTSQKLHQLLKRVDAVKADAVHPNDRRKIIR